MHLHLGLPLLSLLAVCTPVLAQTLHRSGPAQDRFDLVILADGYTASERGEFDQEARKLFDAFRTSEPFDQYMGMINVHVGFRPSPRSGATADNAYGTRFRTTFGTRLLPDRATLVLQDAVRAGGEADAVCVIVNSNRRGGTASGNLCYVSAGVLPYVGLHELGHAIGRLGDEYGSFSGTPQLTRAQYSQLYPNLTTANTRDALPWKAWVASGTRVPASLFTGGVSAYEGGGVYSSGLYRPERRCRMRSDVPDFCAVCRQHLVMALHADSNPLRLQVTGSGSARRVRVVGALPDGRWATRWNGVQGSGLEARVPAGVNASVTIEDATPWVRGEFRSAVRYQFDARSGSGGASSGGAGRPARVVNVNSRLRVRERPTTSSSILGHLSPGERVQVVGNAQSGWYPIAFQGGVGYVSASFLRLETSNAGVSEVVGQWR